MANIYTDFVTGNDANAGTLSSPKKTIQGAVDIWNSGDFIYIGNSTQVLTVEIDFSGISFSQSDPIRFFAYDSGGGIELDFANTVKVMAEIDGDGVCSQLGENFAVFYTGMVFSNIIFTNFTNILFNNDTVICYECYFPDTFTNVLCSRPSIFLACKFISTNNTPILVNPKLLMGNIIEGAQFTAINAPSLSIQNIYLNGTYSLFLDDNGVSINDIFYNCEEGLWTDNSTGEIVINGVFENCTYGMTKTASSFPDVVLNSNYFNNTNDVLGNFNKVPIFKDQNVSAATFYVNAPTSFELNKSSVAYQNNFPVGIIDYIGLTYRDSGAFGSAPVSPSSSSSCIQKTKSMVTLSNAEIDYLIQLQTTGAKIKDREPFTFSQNMVNDFSNDKYVYFGDLTFFGGNDATGILCEVNNNTNVANTLSVKFEKSPSDLLSSPAAFSNVLFNQITCANSAEITVYFVGWRCLKI